MQNSDSKCIVLINTVNLLHVLFDICRHAKLWIELLLSDEIMFYRPPPPAHRTPITACTFITCAEASCTLWWQSSAVDAVMCVNCCVLPGEVRPF